MKVVVAGRRWGKTILAKTSRRWQPLVGAAENLCARLKANPPSDGLAHTFALSKRSLGGFTSVGFILDGEIVSGNFNKTVGDVRRQSAQATSAFFNAFDILPLALFRTARTASPSSPTSSAARCWRCWCPTRSATPRSGRQSATG